MRYKPETPKGKVKKIYENIENTQRNMEAADEMIASAPYEQMKKDLSDKNKRRERALESLRDQVKDEQND